MTVPARPPFVTGERSTGRNSRNRHRRSKPTPGQQPDRVHNDNRAPIADQHPQNPIFSTLLDRIAGRFERVDTRFERIDAEFVRVRGEMALGFARQTRMMVYGFVATIVANAGVVAAIVGAGS
jgi:hypothetical protein